MWKCLFTASGLKCYVCTTRENCQKLDCSPGLDRCSSTTMEGKMLIARQDGSQQHFKAVTHVSALNIFHLNIQESRSRAALPVLNAEIRLSAAKGICATVPFPRAPASCFCCFPPPSWPSLSKVLSHFVGRIFLSTERFLKNDPIKGSTHTTLQSFWEEMSLKYIQPWNLFDCCSIRRRFLWL